MADFVTVVLDDGTEVVFQSAESDLVAPRGGPPVVERYEAAMDALGRMARATQRVCASFVEKMKPASFSSRSASDCPVRWAGSLRSPSWKPA